VSRAVVSTEKAEFSAGRSNKPDGKLHQGAKLKVAILGDFSGRESRQLCEPESLAARRAFRLSKDNFESLFEQMKVGLQLPLMQDPLWLLEFDDLHPDYLYHRVPIFRKFIDLEKRLLTPAEFPRAAAEIQQWQPALRGIDVSRPATATQSMLDAILSGSLYRDQYECSTDSGIDRLIKDIVAPYVQTKADTSQEIYLQAVRQAASETMRKIMHHSDFRQLEASWRSLHLLMRRLVEHPNLEVHLIDVSKAEILADFAQAESDLEQSQLFQRLVVREAVAGGGPYNLVVGDFYIADDERDLHLLIDFATIAESADSALLFGGDVRLAGCPSLAGSPDPDDWHYTLSQEFEQSWQAVREYDACRHVALAAPRFMLRLPYGADTARTESFDYEELTADLGHQYYLWGNSAYLLALSLCHQFVNSGQPAAVAADCYTDLPLHLRKMPQGTWVTPCAETLMNDRAAARFTSAGISTLRSVQGKDEILLPRLQSLSGTDLRGPWCSAR